MRREWLEQGPKPVGTNKHPFAQVTCTFPTQTMGRRFGNSPCPVEQGVRRRACRQLGRLLENLNHINVFNHAARGEDLTFSRPRLLQDVLATNFPYRESDGVANP